MRPRRLRPVKSALDVGAVQTWNRQARLRGVVQKSVAATAADKHKVVAWEADVAKSAAGVKVGGVYDVSVVDQPTSKIY